MGILEHTQTPHDWKCGREINMYSCLGARLRGKQYIQDIEDTSERVKEMQTKEEALNPETDEKDKRTFFDKILFILRRCYFGIFG